MRFVGIAETKAKLSEILRDSNNEDIIITSRGKPKALIRSLEGEDFEDFILSNSTKIKKSLKKAWEAYKRGDMVDWEDLISSKRGNASG